MNYDTDDFSMFDQTPCTAESDVTYYEKGEINDTSKYIQNSACQDCPDNYICDGTAPTIPALTRALRTLP